MKHLSLISLEIFLGFIDSLTFSVDLLGGGAFVLNNTFTISSNGKVSLGCIVMRCESHRFFASGFSKRMLSASILNSSNYYIKGSLIVPLLVTYTSLLYISFAGRDSFRAKHSSKGVSRKIYLFITFFFTKLK